MILRHVALPAEIAGQLFLSAMPGRTMPIAAFVAATAEASIGHVLCLTADGEIARKSPDYGALVAAGGLPWRRHVHAIEDFAIPADPAAFASWIAAMAALLAGGERMVLHCAAGIGRTGTVAQCLLMEAGLDRAGVGRLVEAAGSHPETADQRAFAERFAQSPGRSPAD